MKELHDPPVARAQVVPRARSQEPPVPRRTVSGLLIDSHVHCHERFELGTMLHRAASNFAIARQQLSQSPASSPGCLLLAETPMDDVFRVLEEHAETGATIESPGLASWRVCRTSEPFSLTCVRARPAAGAESSAEATEEEVFVLAGKQIVVRENIEVLALCCKRQFPVGRSLKSTLEAVIRAGAIPVLPWGFGKWRFARGALVRKVLESGFNTCVYLGDNGNRLAISRKPAMFRLAAERNVRILPGSDPLPLRGRERDAGRYGFFLQGEADLARPGAWIRQRLRDHGATIRPFGRREGVLRFCISQAAMQLRRGLG